MAEEKGDLKGLLTKFAETTYTKGVPRIIKSTSWFLKLIWAIGVFLGGGMAVYQITKIALDFLEYPTVTSLVQKFEHSEFPDMTICNKYPMSTRNFKSLTPQDYFMKYGK